MRQGQGLSLVVGKGHRLFVPSGAAPDGTIFLLRQVPGDTVMVEATARNYAGTYTPKVTLTLNYNGCSSGSSQPLEVYRRRSDGSWERKGGQYGTGQPIVYVELDSLSTYVLASPG